MTHDHRDLHVTVLVAAVYALPAAIGLRPIVDLDIWWHLRQGAWIVEHRTLPLTDPFTSYGAGKSWIAYSWLYEIVVYALYRAFGLLGIVIYTTALAFGITWALHRLLSRLTDDLVVASALTALALAGMYPVLGEPRPWLFNVLFFILELTVLLEVRRSGRTRPLWALPPLFLVWACINIQFVYGLFVLVLAAAEPMIQRWTRLADANGKFRARPMIVTLVGCVLATCLTPYHIKIYIPVVTAVRLTDPFLFLMELQAPPFRLIFDWIVLALLLAAAFALGRQQVVSPFLLLLVATGAFLAFRARRDVWVVVIGSVIILAMACARSGIRRTVLRGARLAIVALVVAAMSIGLGVARVSAWRLDRAVSENFPVDAAAFVEQHGYRGHVYNHYNWGGYLMWRLPDLDVSMDGRNPVHGDERIWASIRTWDGRPGWSSDPELTAANLVIADINSPLSSLLHGDARFALVYKDRVAAVFVNRQ